MAKRTYTDRDRAMVRASLEGNGGIVKRTARETGVPVMTVSDWKRKWEMEGLPPGVAEVLPAVRDEFVREATRVRNKALDRFEQKIDADKVLPKDLLVAVGILTDKVRLIEGKPTSRTEAIGAGSLPVEEVRELFAGFARGVVEAASKRAEVISSHTEEEPIDVEFEQVREPLSLVSGS